MVHPKFLAIRIVVGKSSPIKFPNEVLATRTSCYTARIDIHNQHPPRFMLTRVDAQLKQVRAFPCSPCRTCGSEVAKSAPFFQIGQSIEADLMLSRQYRDHDPFPAGLMPEHFWIAKSL